MCKDQSDCNNKDYLSSINLDQVNKYCISNAYWSSIDGIYEYDGCDDGLPYYTLKNGISGCEIRLTFDWETGYWMIKDLSKTLFDYPIALCVSSNIEDCSQYLFELKDDGTEEDYFKNEYVEIYQCNDNYTQFSATTSGDNCPDTETPYQTTEETAADTTDDVTSKPDIDSGDSTPTGDHDTTTATTTTTNNNNNGNNNSSSNNDNSLLIVLIVIGGVVAVFLGIGVCLLYKIYDQNTRKALESVISNEKDIDEKKKEEKEKEREPEREKEKEKEKEQDINDNNRHKASGFGGIHIEKIEKIEKIEQHFHGHHPHASNNNIPDINDISVFLSNNGNNGHYSSSNSVVLTHVRHSKSPKSIANPSVPSSTFALSSQYWREPTKTTSGFKD